MSRPRTWKVLSEFPGADGSIPLQCPVCERDAEVPTCGRAPIIAISYMMLIMDPSDAVPPPGFLPEQIQCRKCRTVFSSGPEPGGASLARAG